MSDASSRFGTRRAMQAWLAVLLWGTLVLGFGSDDFSLTSTSRILRPLLEWLLPDTPAGRIQALQFMTRKLAHVAEYGLLALLALRAFRIGSALSPLRSAGAALALALVVAAADEFHQGHSLLRTGSLRDVGLDGAGAAICLAAALAIGAACRRRTQQPIDTPAQAD